ncbi:MAG: pyridoxal-dependent decarboxylase [Gammaproteobacteria bacterium]|nr:pyridoxal-dependent decarboxylase [Gammaproteobacteria bacterium]
MSELGWSAAELQALNAAARRLEAGFSDLPPGQPAEAAIDDALTAVLLETAQRLQDNFPYFHPRYVGQMLKPPHPLARLAYALAMLINPNNHALDGGRASSAMEREAVADLAAMVGWSTHLGHLTGGGTLANLEALWVAGQLAPGQVMLASQQAHYTHERLASVLGLPFESLPADRFGRMDMAALQARLTGGDVGTVVATAGTTGLGAVDPVADLAELRERFGFRLHVDAAYGGYFGLCEGLKPVVRRHLDYLGRADSLVVDPHKHGLQPYGCGAVLYPDPAVADLYRHDSPYTYFTEAELHLGEISLECSRAGAAATALWATQRLLPPVRGGAFAADLGRCLEAAAELHRRLAADGRFLTLAEPDLDIVVWAPRAATGAAVSEASRELFEAAAARHLHLALIRLDTDLLERHWPEVALSASAQVTCLRCCLMKPEHLDWLDDLWSLIDELAGGAGA